MEPEAQAMEHIGSAIGNLRAAASFLMRREQNSEETAATLKLADEADKLMKAVGFNLAAKR